MDMYGFDDYGQSLIDDNPALSGIQDQLDVASGLADVDAEALYDSAGIGRDDAYDYSDSGDTSDTSDSDADDDDREYCEDCEDCGKYHVVDESDSDDADSDEDEDDIVDTADEQEDRDWATNQMMESQIAVTQGQIDTFGY